MVKMVVVTMETKDTIRFLKGGGRKDNHGDNFYGTDDGGWLWYIKILTTSWRWFKISEMALLTLLFRQTPRDSTINIMFEVREGDIGENPIEA